MLRRSLSKRQISLISTSGLQIQMMRYSLITSALVTALFAVTGVQAASCKIPKSYYKNVSCTASSGYFLAVKDFGAPVALINSQGKSLVDLSRYQKVDADKISSGLLPVMRNGHVGYLNMQGREVIPVMYDALSGGQGWARPVSEGRIVVKQGGHYGVIDTANKTIVPFSASISDIDNYRGGMARVRKNKAISWLDKSGNAKSDPNSSANTQSPSKKESANNVNNANASEQRPALASRFTTLQPRQQDGKWGFIDDNNVTMITYSFDEARAFSEGLAGVRINGEWGFINLGGELVIPFGFDNFNNNSVSTDDNYKDKPSFVFIEDKAWIGSLENGNKMCIDKAGAAVGCD
ncbi:WG repeat-containing protein [Psychrobacter sp. DAB_AL62B]|nr:WG repeat-containing protein [Psychrobacter sp. DAB_AL62B]